MYNKDIVFTYNRCICIYNMYTFKNKLFVQKILSFLKAAYQSLGEIMKPI